MSALDKLLPLRRRLLDIAKKLQPFGLLLARLSVGLIFMSTGWGKVHSVDKVTQYFIELHIPAPGFHAVLVGWTELLGGTALVLGLVTRLAAIPLIISMVVAILTARMKDVHGFFDLVGLEEFTYLMVMAMLVFVGPGHWSIDRVLQKRFVPEEVDK
jgi:putative oxidoreductase